MRKTIPIVGVLSVLALAGCTGGITSGTVTGKEHHDAYTYSTVMCYPSGKTTICLPQTYSEPERWELDLKNGDSTGSVDVTQQAYDQVHVGDVWGGK